MIHADHQVFTPLLGLVENPLRPLGGEGERPLNQHVHTGRQRGEDVRLMQVIRGTNRDGIELLVLQELLDVAECVADPETGAECAGLGEVGVADGDDLHALQLSEDGEMGHLGDRPGANDAQLECVGHAIPRSVGSVRAAQ